MFPFDDVIMIQDIMSCSSHIWWLVGQRMQMRHIYSSHDDGYITRNKRNEKISSLLFIYLELSSMLDILTYYV